MEEQQEVQRRAAPTTAPQFEAVAEAARRVREEKGLRILYLAFSHKTRLDLDWLKTRYHLYVVEAMNLRATACQQTLGTRQMVEGTQTASPAGLALEFFGALGGNEPVDPQVYSKLEELLFKLQRNLSSPFPGMCQLVSLLADSPGWPVPAQQHARLAQVEEALEEHTDVLRVADKVLLPVMALQVVLDTFGVKLAAEQLKNMYTELLSNRECSGMAAEGADTLADDTRAELYDALHLLSPPGHARKAVHQVLEVVEVSPAVRDFLDELANAIDAKEKLGEYVYEFTYDQMGLVCEAAACCFTTLTSLLEGMRMDDYAGPHYNTLMLTCASGYDPAVVNMLYVYMEIGRHNVQDVLGLVAMHHGLESEMGFWVAELAQRRFQVAELFDNEYSAKLRKHRHTSEVLADHVQRIYADLGGKLKKVEEEQAALQQAHAALKQTVDEDMAALKQQVGTLQDVVLSLTAALEKKPLTPTRRAAAALSRLVISSPAEEPVPFGSRVASPEQGEEPRQPEASAAASSHTADVAAAEPAAAESDAAPAPAAAQLVASTAAAPTAAVAPAVGAAGSEPAGAAAVGGPAERSSQAVGRSLYGTGRHAAQRGDIRHAARRVQQAADEQAMQDWQFLGNSSGVRERRLGGSTAPAASGAYSRALLQPRWQR